MLLFKKKKEKVVTEPNNLILVLDEKVFRVDKKVYDYIKSLEDKERELSKVQHELEAIKPIFESKDYKPAISEDCGKCKYVVRSSYYNGRIIGCRKDNVCEDYSPIDEE